MRVLLLNDIEFGFWVLVLFLQMQPLPHVGDCVVLYRAAQVN